MGKRETTVEYMTFINHTECHCQSRNPVSHHMTSPNHSTMTSGIYAQSEINNNNRSNNNLCQCVRHFKVFHERVDSSDEDDGHDTRTRPPCRCDCESENGSCEWLKKGKDGFSLEDRRCIIDKRCLRPTCEYGQYSKQIGRCPKLEDKLSGAKNLFFD